MDGQRLTIWSGELHYWRSPSPQHWRDIFQKMKAAGFNAVSLYFFWATTSAPDLPLDFSGIRDVDLLLRLADQQRHHHPLRPRPHQLGATTHLAPQHQPHPGPPPGHHRRRLRPPVPSGNEEPDDSKPYENYLARLVKVARADGITVPIFHNHPRPAITGHTARREPVSTPTHH
ncbi:MAG: beta-galactosidase [Lawsonella clevelandensis]